MLLALLHLNEFFPDPPGGINQLVEPLELHRILRLLVVGLFARLLPEREKGRVRMRVERSTDERER